MLDNKPKLRLYNTKEEVFGQEAKAFALGSIVGDATLVQNRMIIDQSEKDYTEWKKEKCVELHLATKESSILVCNRKRKDDKTGEIKKFTSYRFYTKSLFRDFHQFYVVKKDGDPTYREGEKPKRRKKFIPELVDWFTHPLALAIYYMDDGGAYNNQAYFATGECTFEEVEIMREVFQKNFDLDTSVIKQYQKPKGILVRRKDCGKLLDLVECYVSQVPGMARKLKITRPTP